MLEHGGRLRRAAAEHQIPLADWLDLSTGINPAGYPVPPIDPMCWNRLPEDDDGLEEAAAAYYANPRLLVLPGSQAGIQGLPGLLPRGVVACVAPLYEEHPQAWARAGHKLRRLPTLARALAAATPNVLLCNPNNPTATALDRETLVVAAETLRKRGGVLIVDEAFADPEPERSVVDLAGSTDAPNLIVLRSLGKFFGLAGARVGFLFAGETLRHTLREALGPWPVAHPARAVARAALLDTAWQAAARQALATAALRLADVLAPLSGTPDAVTRTPLFCTLRVENQETLAGLDAYFSRRAILVRRFDEHGLLRFGLPPDEAGWERLSTAVAAWLEGA